MCVYFEQILYLINVNGKHRLFIGPKASISLIYNVCEIVYVRSYFILFSKKYEICRRIRTYDYVQVRLCMLSSYLCKITLIFGNRLVIGNLKMIEFVKKTAK